MAETQDTKELKNTGYEIFIGFLSLLSIFNLLLITFAKSDTQFQNILYIMNGVFTLIFLGDFTYRMITATSKSGYFFRDFGWADLLASLPFPQTKILRVFRLLRVYRLMKAYGAKYILRTLIKDRAGSALYILLIMGFLVLEFGSLFMLRAESTSPNANITTGGDAVWYSIVTISTVGYGDKYPVTPWGRLIGSTIIVIGVGIFGTFTGFLANFFLSPAKKEEEQATEPADTQTQLEAFKALLDEQEKTNAALREKLAQLETHIAK